MSDASQHDVEQEVQQGALVNVLGTIGKIAGPSFLILVTRLYGADVFGIFITAAAFIESGLAFLTAGFKDGALLSVARHAGHTHERDRLYRLLSNTLGWSLLFSVLLIALAFALGPWLLPMLYDAYGAELLSMVRWMILVLPLLAFDRIVIAATQGLKIMRYDAIFNGGVRPVLLLATAVGCWFWMPTTAGLAAAYVLTQVVLGLAAVWIFSRELDWGALFAAFRTFTIDREMLAFAIPQNLNMTLERFITNIDIIMLGMFGVSASTTGFYGAGAMIVRELLTIKQVFSNAFVPHVVRLHRHGNRQDLSRLFSKVSRWTATLVVPALLAVAVLRTDVLRLVSPEFGSADALFMLALLPIPYLQCSAGLAGNIVVMTGHSRLNLLNSTTTALVNTVLNLWLIPALGLLGAALASAVATLLKTAMELVEARVVAGARLAVRLAYPPHVAGFLVGALVAWGFAALPAFDASLWARLATLGGALLLYAGLFAALSGRLPLPPLQATPAPEVPDG